MTGFANQTRKFLFALDTPSAVAVTADESYVTGWFVPQNGEAYELWLVAGQTRIQAFTGLPRPDAAHHHNNNPVFKRSGFLAHFKGFRNASSVRLIARMEDTEIVLADRIAVPAYSADASAQAEYEAVNSELASLPYQPLLSILLPISDSHPYLVSRSVESLRQQHYRNWQLCIACVSLELSSSLDYLEKTASQDSRLKLVEAANGRGSELCEQALAMAEGDFILRLDCGDELHPLALAEIVEALNTGGNTTLVYADEEEIDFYGNHRQRFSKPDFDPEAFLSWNFIGNGAAIRRSAALQAEGYKAQSERCDDWDLLLRVVETARPEQIRHIARPLYRCRRGDDLTGSFSKSIANHSPDQICSGTVSDHLIRIGISATLEPGLFAGSLRVRYPREPDVRTAVVVRAGDGSFQQAALAPNIDPRRARVYELLGSYADLLVDSRLWQEDEEAAGSLGRLTETDADIFIFINRPLDTVNHHFVEELTAQAMRKDCGLVTGIAIDRNELILHAGFHRTPGNQWIDAFRGSKFSQSELPRNLNVVRSVDSISDEFFAVRGSRLRSLGELAAISSASMPQIVKQLVDLARADNSRILVTPYAVATFDIVGPYDHPKTDGPMLEDDQIEHSRAGDSSYCELQDELRAAQVDRRLAATQLREIANERNRLRRELDASLEALARAEMSRSEGQQEQVHELTGAIEAERRVVVGLTESLSWKLTAPLRACLRLVRRK